MLRTIIENQPTFAHFKFLIEHDPSLIEPFNRYEQKERLQEELYTFVLRVGHKLSITKTELEQCKASFKSNYPPIAPKTETWAPDITVNWVAFKTAMLQNLNVNQISRLALKFIHCFDTQTQTWYLSVQRLLMKWLDSADPIPGKDYDLEYSCTSKRAICSLLPGKIGAASNSIVYDVPVCPYDLTYFQSVKDSSSNPIQQGTHVQSITFPWEEFNQLQSKNDDSGKRPPADFDIVFCSISYDMGTVPNTESCVQWPHSIAIYMRHDKTDLLNNSNVVIINKACDLGGICPPRCANVLYSFDPLY